MGLQRKISRWAGGYLYLRGTGYSGERFFNLCKNARLDYWSVRQQKDGYYFYMSLKDFYKIRPLLRKSHMSIRILSRLGMPFILHENRKRKALAIAVLSFFVFLYAMSLFIWNISFEGNYHYTRETLLDYLKEQDIQYGMMKHKISCEQLEENIRSRFPEITWVSARVSGTRLLVKIKENEVLSSIPEPENEPCELVAKRAGVITRMIIRQGKAAVAEGDTVEKDQLLVTGQLSILNDAGEVVKIAYVHADGDIYAKTIYHYEEEFPQYCTINVKTGKKRHGIGIMAGPYRLRFLMPDFGDTSWNYVTNLTQLCLFEDFYLPFYIEKITGEAFVSYERPYTQEEKEEEARILEEEYLKNLTEKGVQIIENNVKIQEYGGSWKAEGNVTVEEQIGVTNYITEFEETRQTNERD